MEIQEAIEHLMLAHSLMPKNTEVLIKLSSVLFKELHQTKEAIQYIKKALDIEPENPEINCLLGKFYLKEAMAKEAVDCLMKAAQN